MVEKITNANERASIYWCKHMTAGLAGYPELEGNVLVTNEVMQKMAPSMEAVPIYLNHVGDNSDQKEVGYIAQSKYCNGDGWLHAKMHIFDEEAKRLINQGWSVSNGYTPLQKAGEGVFNNISYKEQILDGKFFHLALTQQPRYENAKIFNEQEYIEYCNTLDQKMLNSISESVLSEHKKQSNFDVNNSDIDMTEEIKNDVENAKEPIDNKKENEAEKPKDKFDVMNETVKAGDEDVPVKTLLNFYMKNKDKVNMKGKEDEKMNMEKKKMNMEDKKEKMTNEVEQGASEDWFTNSFNKVPAMECVDTNKIGKRGF